MDYRVLLYYCFTELDRPEEFAVQHRELCEGLGLKGRILIAKEGINGTVSGTTESTGRYQQALADVPEFSGIEFKVDQAKGHAFKNLQVKARSEIISLGEPVSLPVHQRTGQHLTPKQWHQMMQEDGVVLLDGRNNYESELGHFEGALCPDVETFRDFPAWIRAHRTHFQGKKILTYCTGGIRCEKLSAWMLEEGFEEVFQLHGGIVEYGKDPEIQGDKFLGMNVVFDDRVLVPPSPQAEPITRCRECNAPSANYVNCANVRCNLRMILCPDCELSTLRCCSEECRSKPHLREKNAKLRASSP